MEQSLIPPEVEQESDQSGLVAGYWRRFLIAMVLMLMVNAIPLYTSSRVMDGERSIGWPFKALRRPANVLEFTLDPTALSENIVVALVVSHLVAQCLKDGWRYGFRNLFLSR